MTVTDMSAIATLSDFDMLKLIACRSEEYDL